MARTVNLLSHTVRREAFLDVAQQLIQTKGYEQMSIQDVLDALETSRGAFYHYFDSKLALLEAVVDRYGEGAVQAVQPILNDASLPAVRKLEQIVGAFARLKAQSKDLMVALMEVMNSDANALFREKLRRMASERLGPVLAAVIQQGIKEGTFKPVGGKDAMWVVLSLMQGYQQLATEQFIARQENRIGFEVVKRTNAAYTEAFERVLGLSPGSLRLVDEATLHFWFG